MTWISLLGVTLAVWKSWWRDARRDDPGRLTFPRQLLMRGTPDDPGAWPETSPFESGIHEGLPYLAMELIEGLTLRHYLDVRAEDSYRASGVQIKDAYATLRDGEVVIIDPAPATFRG